MAQLIDTSIFVELERRSLHLSALGSIIPGETLALAAITASELLTGIYRADSPERRQRREVFVEAILGAVPVLPFDLRVARMHAKIWADLTAAGQPIGANDLLIAATALAHGYGIFTANVRHFQRVSGLLVSHPDW